MFKPGVADCKIPPLVFCVFLLKNLFGDYKFSKMLEKFTKKFIIYINSCMVGQSELF